MRSPLLPILALGLLGGCAAGTAEAGKPYVPPALPSTGELAAYVAAHWRDEYGPVFANFAGHRGEASTLLRVEKVACGYRHITPECSFEAVARLASGEEARQNMFSQFERKEDGSLESVIAVYDRRVRRR